MRAALVLVALAVAGCASSPPREVVLTGAAARIAQHETDHLDGVMHFQHLPLAERGALLSEYEALR